MSRPDRRPAGIRPSLHRVKKSSLGLGGLLGALLGTAACERPAAPPVQPIVPAASPGELAQRSLKPSEPLEEARRSIEERTLRRERLFRELWQPGSLWDALRIEQADIDRGQVTLPTLINLGKELFQIDFSPERGLGNGLAKLKNPLAGARPAPNLRHVHVKEFGGPDGTRCVGCHHVGGIGGAGFTSDNVFLDGDGLRPSSGLTRSPRALFGAALLQKLGEEMTDELRSQVMDARRTLARGGSLPLTAKGISFGTIRIAADGRLDLTAVRGVSSDLVVRPFGWKGTGTSLRQLVVESFQQNLGIQADELVTRPGVYASGQLGSGPPGDPDADGVTHEATEGMVTAVTTYLAALPLPIEDVPETPTFSLRIGRGAAVFEKIGCAGCHVPELPLRSPVVSLGPTPYSRPRVDLSPLLVTAARTGRLGMVRLYSDLKRHDMGDALAEPRGYRGIPQRQWLTPPLWGLGASGPYLHDGRAGNIDDAILAHGGAAQAARDAYEKLVLEDAGALRLFLQSLTRPQHVEFKP